MSPLPETALLPEPENAPRARRSPVVAALLAAGLFLFAATAASTRPGFSATTALHSAGGPMDDHSDDLVFTVDDASMVYTGTVRRGASPAGMTCLI